MTSNLCGAEKEALIDQLDTIIKHLESDYDSVPKQLWPECPPEQEPKNRQIPHPFFKDVYFQAKPHVTDKPVRVTLDGRTAEFNRSRYYQFIEPPLGIPPWYKPRSKSVEIRAGTYMSGCDCWKKNGLQDDCRRWDCARPECLSKPLPECPPSNCPPILGIRKPNAYIN